MRRQQRERGPGLLDPQGGEVGGAVGAGAGVRPLARAEQHDVDALTRGAGGREQSARPEGLVVGVGGHEHEPRGGGVGRAVRWARGQWRHGAPFRSVCPLVLGRARVGVVEGRGRLAHQRTSWLRASRRDRVAEHVTAEGGRVALGVLLPDVELEVGHAARRAPPRGRGEPGPSAWPTRPSTSSTVRATTRRTRRASAAPAAPSAAPRVDRRGGLLAARADAAASAASTAPRCISPTWSGSRCRSCSRRRRATPTAAAPPDRGDPHAAPGEARSLEIPPGWTHGMGRRRGEAHRPARHERQSASDPRPLLDGHAVRGTQPHGIQPAGVVAAPRRHEGAVERPGERAPGLAPTERGRRRSTRRPRGASPGPRRRRRPSGPAPRRPPRRRWPAARASARMASASRWGSTARATVRSTEPSTASEVHSRHVSPDPGSGNAAGWLSRQAESGGHVTPGP